MPQALRELGDQIGKHPHCQHSAEAIGQHVRQSLAAIWQKNSGQQGNKRPRAGYAMQETDAQSGVPVPQMCSRRMGFRTMQMEVLVGRPTLMRMAVDVQMRPVGDAQAPQPNTDQGDPNQALCQAGQDIQGEHPTNERDYQCQQPCANRVASAPAHTYPSAGAGSPHAERQDRGQMIWTEQRVQRPSQQTRASSNQYRVSDHQTSG